MDTWTKFVITLAAGVVIAAVAFFVFPRTRGVRPAPTLTPRLANILFALMFIAYCAVFGWYALMRHATFNSGGYDLGIFDQAIWNSVRGRILENTIMIDSPQFLGHHWSPLLVGLVPVYVIWSDVRALLVFQVIALGAGGLPLYWLAKKRLGYALALVVAAAWFLYPALQNVALFEFHEIALVTPLLAFALFFLLNHKLAPFFVCLGLALMLKEEVAFIAAAFGVYLIFVERQRALGIVVTLASLVWAYAVVSWVIPYFYGPVYGGNYYFVERYTYLGKTVSEIIHNAVTQPQLVLAQLLLPEKIDFVFQLLVPVAFIPLVGIEVFALALPSMAYLLSSDFPSQSSIRYQYTAPLIPFVFFALVIGMERLLRLRPLRGMDVRRVQLVMGILLAVTAVGDYYFQSWGPLSQYPQVLSYVDTPHIEMGYQLMAMIPPNASVIADSNFVPHMSQREVVYQPGIVPDLRAIDYLLSDSTLPAHAKYGFIWRDILPLPFFETIYDQDGYLLKKQAAFQYDQPTNIQFEKGMLLAGYNPPKQQPLKRGANVNFVLAWQANQAVTDRYAVFLHLRDAAGNLWAQDDHEPGNGWLRTDGWKAGDKTLDGYKLALPAYMPPGQYTATVGMYRVDNGERLKASDKDGKSLGDEPVLGTFTVGAEMNPIAPNAVEIAAPKRKNVGTLQLLGSTTLPERMESGDTVHLGLYWRALDAPKQDSTIHLALLGANRKIAFESADSVDVPYPTGQWSKGEIVLQWHTFQLDPSFEPGEYQLAALVHAAAGKKPLRVILGPVTVERTEHNYTPPTVTHPLQADFGNAIRLVGYDSATNADTVSLKLYWQSLAPVSTSYTVFVHLLDAQNQIVAQQDQIPMAGSYPTTRWLANEFITDEYTLTVPPASPATQIELGLYDAATGQRVARADGSDHLVIPLGK